MSAGALDASWLLENNGNEPGVVWLKSMDLGWPDTYSMEVKYTGVDIIGSGPSWWSNFEQFI